MKDLLNKEKINKIAKKFNLDLVMLFGSRAKGHAHKNSDYDIAVQRKKALSFNDELALWREFGDIFGDKIDLVIVKHLDPLLLWQIADNAVLLFGSQRNFTKFKLYAFHCYNDYEPYFKLEEEFVKKQVAKL